MRRSKPLGSLREAIRGAPLPSDGPPIGLAFEMKMAPVQRDPPWPSGIEGEFTLLNHLLVEMAKLGRYERREHSRRKGAIRRLDMLRSARQKQWSSTRGGSDTV